MQDAVYSRMVERGFNLTIRDTEKLFKSIELKFKSQMEKADEN